MRASTKELLAIASMAIAASSWAFPPPALEGRASVPAAGEPGTFSPTPGNGGLLASPAQDETTAVDPSHAAMPSPASFQPDASAPNTKDRIEPSRPETAGSEIVGAPIPKMPAFTVVGDHVFGFRDRDINTKEGEIALSFQRHPGLHVGNAFHLNEDAAHEMFLRDDWRSTKKDYSDMANAMATGGDPAEGRMIIKAVRDEDMEMRADSANESALPAMDRTQVAHLEADSKLLQAPEDPVDIPFVRVKW